MINPKPPQGPSPIEMAISPDEIGLFERICRSATDIAEDDQATIKDRGFNDPELGKTDVYHIQAANQRVYVVKPETETPLAEGRAVLFSARPHKVIPTDGISWKVDYFNDDTVESVIYKYGKEEASRGPFDGAMSVIGEYVDGH